MTPVRNPSHRLLAAVAAPSLVALVLACAQTGSGARVTRGVAPSGSVAPDSLSESALAARLVCHDTLGRPEFDTRRTNVSRCTPCLPIGVKDRPSRAIAHARRLWRQGARAPFDSTDLGAECVRLTYAAARAALPDDDTLGVEIALFELADVRDSVRAQALVAVDEMIGRLMTEERSRDASLVMTQFAMGIWDRAERLLERPIGLDEHEFERAVHGIGGPSLAHLPRRPEPSRILGESEAEWSARLFTAALRLREEHADARAERTRLARLALAPWVVLGRWASLDSAARALARLVPGDSVWRPARALAAYRQITDPIAQASAVMALFDSAMAAMPRADSLHYDGFDGVLTADDDEWRYGFLPDDRVRLEARGWSVLDPMWSTPVNELRLERRARVAEADFRYAAVAGAGASGSETRMGQMLVRRGVPVTQWRYEEPSFTGDAVRLARRWGAWTATAEVSPSADLWRIFYGSHFGADRLLTYAPPPDAGCVTTLEGVPTFWSCALTKRADWRGVLYYGTTDAVDVSLVRFRAPGDSADVYLGARFPLRRFSPRNALGTQPSDRIRLGMWLTTPEGRTVVHEEDVRGRPAAGEIAWQTQWRSRVGSFQLMHRVEAMDSTQRRGARGVAQFTSDAMVAFPLRGFGMSDILLADSARLRRDGRARSGVSAEQTRWRDLEIVPNAAVVRPNQRFAMVWEVYDLAAGPDGRMRWRVRIKRERGEVRVGTDMQAVMRGARSAGTRVVAAESDAPDVSFDRGERAAPAVLENITFVLTDAPEGRHVVHVTIDDLVAGRSVTRSLSVRVLDPSTERRGAPPARAPSSPPSR